jgi:hypothetical protein
MKFLLFFIISLNAYSATKVSDCGKYDIYGQIRKNDAKKSYELVVNLGSISEYKFELSDEQERQMISYSGHTIKVTANILKKVPDYNGKLNSIFKIDYAIPDPANLDGIGGFVLIKKEKCK